MYNIFDTNMNNCFEYIEGIEIDDNLLHKTVSDILSDGLKSTWKTEERKSFNLDDQYNIESSVYDQFQVQPNVVKLIKDQINLDLHDNLIIYQVLRNGIPKHTDAKRKSILNYIIDTGGNNVITKWYDSNNNIINQLVVPEKKWYRMKTDIDHSIEGITSDRLMITISLL